MIVGLLPGGGELYIIAGVVVLLFGATALPKFARSIGQAKTEFEKGVTEGSKEDEQGKGKSEDKKEDKK